MVAWDRSVQVQQHFNDICWRIRSLALTALTFILGGTFYAYVNAGPISIFGWERSPAIFFPLVGILLWIPFYRMDHQWYHVLLRGAVNEGRWLESQLRDAGVDIRLSSVIRYYSRYRDKEYKSPKLTHVNLLSPIPKTEDWHATSEDAHREGDTGNPQKEEQSPRGKRARDKLRNFYVFGVVALAVTWAILIFIPNDATVVAPHCTTISFHQHPATVCK
jgi:hypothetical protein